MVMNEAPQAVSLEDANCVAIDFETADYGADSACAVGLARVERGVVVDTLYQLLRPPRRSELFTGIHGLTWPMLRDQPAFGEFWPVMSAFLANTPFLVAHNAPFDRGVLAACLARCGAASPALLAAGGAHPPFLCTLKGARQALRLPHNRLDDVCAHFGLALDHHHAGSDARAAAEIYLRLRWLGLANETLRIRPSSYSATRARAGR